MPSPIEWTIEEYQKTVTRSRFKCQGITVDLDELIQTLERIEDTAYDRLQIGHGRTVSRDNIYNKDLIPILWKFGVFTKQFNHSYNGRDWFTKYQIDFYKIDEFAEKLGYMA